ncbi:amino acid ABC transporter substrate-binding protein [Paralimibaculum aggregatum]|uniref:Amino acid ABC transporter substrate-binding protein n=1 Tax=Paralimibaculum aggregatum TaxID=3036245 RepID=A0ABQ6LT81_9RHOB|nr:amino acid ABC transporter substrate-binding protein [Limibaculum sp. NKW23]GMG85282.1 amino acid ABC transporter substrate-binding protein [Limibaculum sp. NKW23]
MTASFPPRARGDRVTGAQHSGVAQRRAPRRALLWGLLAALLAAAQAGPLAPAAGAGERLDRIVESGKVRFGFRTDAPPFSSLVAGRPQGFTVDLCALVAKAIKETAGLETITANFQPVDTGARFEAIAAGEIDVLCGATTATLGRRETVSFSLPVFHTGVSVVMHPEAPEPLRQLLLEREAVTLSRPALEAALAGQRFGVRRDTTAGDWLAEAAIFGGAGPEVVDFATHEAGIAAVRAGEIAGYFADQAILLGQINGGAAEHGLLLSARTFTHEPYALALPRGDEDFLLVIDRALSRLYRQHRIVPLLEYHFGPVAPEARQFYQLIAQPE